MKLATLASLGLATTLALSGCAGSPSSNSSGSESALNAELPESIREAGVLRIGGYADIAPYLYKQGPEVAGFEKQLMDALGEVLGVKVEFKNTAFDGLIPGLQSGKLDVAMGDLTDTLERQKAVTFVDYTKSFQALFVQDGNPNDLQSVADLCGKTLAVVPGSVGADVAHEQQTACEKAGEPDIERLSFGGSPSAFTSIQTGRADVFIIDYVIGSHAAESGAAGEVAGEPFYDQLHGAVVREDNDELAGALESAFTEIMDDGTYDKILRDAGVEDLAMDAPIINGAKS